MTKPDGGVNAELYIKKQMLDPLGNVLCLLLLLIHKTRNIY